jgi:hypothetical protein
MWLFKMTGRACALVAAVPSRFEAWQEMPETFPGDCQALSLRRNTGGVPVLEF